MKAQGALCDRCTLRECRFVPGKGADETDVVIVGEAPGTTEVERGEPFVGPAGKLLDRLLEESGLSRHRVYKTNAVLCRPWPHRAPTKEEVQACRERLRLEVSARRPKVVVGLGATALWSLVGKPHIRKYRGQVWHLEDWPAPVICTYHPAAILHGQNDWYDVVRKDLQLAAQIVEEGADRGEERYPFTYSVRRWSEGAVAELILMVQQSLSAWPWGLDVETASDGRVLCVGIGAWMPRGDRLVPHVLVIPDPEGLAYTPDWMPVMHNGKFDAVALWRAGWEWPHEWEDTMLLHYALEQRPGENRLKDLARRYLLVGDYEREVQQYLSRMEECPPEAMYRYNAADVAYTMYLWRLLRDCAEQDVRAVRLYDGILKPAAVALAHMEYRGIRLDLSALDELDGRLSAEIADLEGKLRGIAEEAGFRKLVRKRSGKRVVEELAGPESFNPRSPEDVEKLLYDHLGLPVVGRVSTDKKALLAIRRYSQHPVLDLLAEFRQREKLRSTYVDSLRRLHRNGRVHGEFHLHTTRTGRLSSSNPNLQNIPKRRTKEIRNLFVASPGYRLVEMDLSQAELRCLAWYSKDPVLIRAFREGWDLHRRTAAAVFGLPEEQVTESQRQAGKTLNFEVMYGGGAQKFVEIVRDEIPDLEITLEQAHRAIRRWFESYPKAAEWIERQKRAGLEQRRVETPLWRVRHFDLVTPENADEIMRQAVNTPIQSLASDLNLLVLIRLHRAFRAGEWDAHLLATVHDSILLELAEGEDLHAFASWLHETALATIYAAIGDDVPWEVEVKAGDRWGSLEEMTVEESPEAVTTSS